MYYIGIDTGGTFTDGVLVDDQGGLFTAKAATTPGDLARGVADCIGKLAALRGIPATELLQGTAQLAHGTTIGTNAIVERKGPKIALIATRGHGDAILMMRGTGRTAGLPAEGLFNILATDVPAPLVPPQMIFEIDERVDNTGAVAVALDPANVDRLADELAAAGVEAIAISLLWSFQNPAHELALLERLQHRCPDAYISCSHQVSPTVGEYERTVATVINAYVGGGASAYLDSLESWLGDNQLGGELLILQCGGGVIPVAEARSVPLLTIGSGPVGGMIGSADLARRLALDDVIVTDMGGTSFEVGVIVGGAMTVRDFNVFHQYKYRVPQVDLVSIGAGGGSIAWLDAATGSLRVGPHSAGAQPGPACYGRGGTQPTVTDANLVLGYLRPDGFLGGEMSLDVEAARTAVGTLAARLGISIDETAGAIREIVDIQMGALIRQQTLVRGLDPRDFTLLAYGGAAALHAAAYSAELGVREVIVPAGNAAAVWSAFGAAAAELLQVVEKDVLVPAPLPTQRLNEVFAEVDAIARERFTGNGYEPRLSRAVKMRYTGQIHRVEVDVPNGAFDDVATAAMLDEFEQKYERLFGPGSVTTQQVELTSVRCNVYGPPREVVLAEAPVQEGASADAAIIGTSPVYWFDARARVDTTVVDGTKLPHGASVAGRAIVVLPFTTIVVPEGFTATLDGLGNFRLRHRKPSATASQRSADHGH